MGSFQMAFAGFYAWWIFLNGAVYFAEFHFIQSFTGIQKKWYMFVYILLNSVLTFLVIYFQSPGMYRFILHIGILACFFRFFMHLKWTDLLAPDQFMNDYEKSSFMDAIRSIARIGMAGRRVGTCDMEYDVKFAVCIDGNGYVHDDIMDELLYTMERDAPEDFEVYKKKSGSDAVWFALHWLMNGNWSLLNSNKTEYKRHKDEQYKKLDEVKLDTTFSGADTSGKKTFLASLVEKLQANQALQTRFFLEQITKMTKTSDGYLMGRKRSLSARA